MVMSGLENTPPRMRAMLQILVTMFQALVSACMPVMERSGKKACPCSVRSTLPASLCAPPRPGTSSSLFCAQAGANFPPLAQPRTPTCHVVDPPPGAPFRHSHDAP